MTLNHQINKQGKGSRSHSPEKNDQKQPPKKNLQVDDIGILRSGSEKKKSVWSSRCNDAIDAINVSKGKRKNKKETSCQHSSIHQKVSSRMEKLTV